LIHVKYDEVTKVIERRIKLGDYFLGGVPGETSHRLRKKEYYNA